MPQRTILIVDDDQTLRELIRIQLEHENYRVLQAANGLEGVDMARQDRPDLVILDITMPEKDGLEACTDIRLFSSLPILMLTARGQNEDVITGLDHGADDYLIKPFHMDELLARIRALLRRTPVAHRPLLVGKGSLNIDQEKREVWVRDELVDLTPTEYQLLVILAEHAGKVVSHHHLLRSVWGQDYNKEHDYLKVYIWHLRRKIEEDPHKPRLLLTEWGIGYRLVA
ncbi:MAG: response regulator transcription factor [Chloroflexaceae bacterium]|nr:response regulator transcription factor [Chloroflexaceae bacterium]